VSKQLEREIGNLFLYDKVNVPLTCTSPMSPHITVLMNDEHGDVCILIHVSHNTHVHMVGKQVLQKAICPERRKGLDSAASAIASVTEVRISNDLQVWHVCPVSCSPAIMHPEILAQLPERWLLIAAGRESVCVDIQRPAGQGSGHRSASQAARVRRPAHCSADNGVQSRSTVPHRV
jgi:hypothetical protein